MFVASADAISGGGVARRGPGAAQAQHIRDVHEHPLGPDETATGFGAAAVYIPTMQDALTTGKARSGLSREESQAMPQRRLTDNELEHLHDTPFWQIKQALEARVIPASGVASSARGARGARGAGVSNGTGVSAPAVPFVSFRNLPFRITIERCEYDNGEPYLCITETTNSVGFLFSLDGKLTHIVNYK